MPGDHSRSAPAGVFIQADSERRFANHLVGKESVRRMYAAEAGIPEQAFVARGAENASPTGYIQTLIHDAPGTLDCAILGSEDLRRPFRAVVDTMRPVLGDALEMRSDRLELDHHLRDGMLDFGMVGQGTGER